MIIEQQSIVDATAASRLRGPSAAILPLVSGLRATRALRSGLDRTVDDAAAAYEIDFRLAQKERQFQDALAPSITSFLSASDSADTSTR